ncbi:MAG TPA: SWIM zinc finger family protein [Trebonia sp.]
MQVRNRYPWPESSGPIRVDGGIKAKSKRGAIGEQWWSRRFISVLESYGMSGRLQRGRSYARSGQVLEFELAQGKVTARVQGSRPQPYKVSIGVLPLTTAQWRAVERRLASQALFRAKLLAGEMPAEIEAVFTDCGTPLFPRSASDLDMRCSCPDWEVPCKHLAAVCYVLAEAFDDDPFGMLAWRGRGKEDLLASLRQPGPREQATAARAGAGAPVGTGSTARAVLADLTGDPPAGRVTDFWSPGLSAARLRALAAPATTTAAPDLLLRMFEPPPLQVRGKDLRDVLSPAYDQLAADD